MNRLNFNQSGGFPLETEILEEMQKATSILNFLGDIVGDFSVISGCNVVGPNITDGCVYVNGEVFFFKGGPVQPTVIIKEDISQREFEDATTKDVIFTRYVAFGVGVGSFNWADFKRPKNTIQLTEDKAEQSLINTLITRITNLEARPLANVPIGMIAIWGQDVSLIPEGWEEYVPLRGKLPIGLDPAYVQGTETINYNLNTLGSTGGERQHQLTIAELPEHDHEVGYTNLDLAGGVDGSLQKQIGLPSSSSKYNTTKVGSNQKHNVMNPYRVVHYIQYVGA